MTAYEALFKQATGHEAYPYQIRLATEPWPDLLNIPTGLGKTAAVVLAWTFRRGYRANGEYHPPDPGTPRRLLMCLPMRVLVEQQRADIEAWLSKLGIVGSPGDGKVSIHTLMGGSEDVRRPRWTDFPEEDTILIGTQDMLLSRALMRGYGMSRYLWPVHFGLLHTDALWVFDEVQLIGAALPTSAQLEAFRRDDRIAPYRPARSLWMSATQRPEWLETVDFRPHLEGQRSLGLDDEDRSLPSVLRRINAPKKLRQADTVLDRTTARQQSKSYLESLANEVLDAHVPGTQTLVIVNRVERAQRLAELLASRAPELPRLLLHARFRAAERREKERRLRNDAIGDTGRIIVATQAIEAGVDISSRVLFTELAPWASLVQRFGRCNRSGEFDAAEIRWIDISDDAEESLLPYTSETLDSARRHLAALNHADPASLPDVTEPRPPAPVIRRRDFLNLFNTDPDLAGYDVDIAPYIRDSGIPSVHVYWRNFGDRPEDDSPPAAEELCPASISELRRYLGHNKAWTWDALAERFTIVDDQRLRPGMTLLLRASDGGYDQELGFVHDSKGSVEVIAVPATNANDAYDRDPLTVSDVWVSLVQHLSDVKSAATLLCRALEMADPLACALIEAAQMHDVGKAHPAFQGALRRTVGVNESPAPEELAPWAKSGNRKRLVYTMPGGERGDGGARPHFRHELASALAWLANPTMDVDIDLTAYLIAAHHGKVRMSLRALPGEREPGESDRLFARGIWDGDLLPEVDLGDRVLPSTMLDLSVMELGMGNLGPSWTDRTQHLLECYGPFRLAWLEALLCVADWRASALERQGVRLQ